MISSGSTVLRFDFDIFSIEPISTGAPVDSERRLRPSASPRSGFQPASTPVAIAAR